MLFYLTVFNKSQRWQCVSSGLLSSWDQENRENGMFTLTNLVLLKLMQFFFSKTSSCILLKKDCFLDSCMTTSYSFSLSHPTATARSMYFLQKKWSLAHASVSALCQCFHSGCCHILHAPTNHILYCSSTNDYLSQFPQDFHSELCR